MLDEEKGKDCGALQTLFLKVSVNYLFLRGLLLPPKQEDLFIVLR